MELLMVFKEELEDTFLEVFAGKKSLFILVP
jgi:hypothetical protein